MGLMLWYELGCGA